ncbi:hypothetical protein ACYX53_12380 [Clostridioides difficile]
MILYVNIFLSDLFYKKAFETQALFLAFSVEAFFPLQKTVIKKTLKESLPENDII